MKTMKKVMTTMMAALLLFLPMQAKAAEVAPQAETLQFVELKEDYYKEVEKDGIANRHDESGNLISTTKVENALFGVNSTLTSGWGQFTMDGKLVKGTFKDATLDTKSYLRCSFTTEDGVVYDQVTVKVTHTTYEEEAKKAAIAQAEAEAQAQAEAAMSSGNGGSGSSTGSGNEGSGSSTGSGITRPTGNTGWTVAPSSISRPYGTGWTAVPSAA